MSDLVLLYTIVVRHVVSYVFHIDVFTKSRAVCKVGIFLSYSSGVTSAWTLVGMTAQRAASVLWPHCVNVLCTRTKSIVVIVSSVLFIACIHLHLLMDLTSFVLTIVHQFCVLFSLATIVISFTMFGHGSIC